MAGKTGAVFGRGDVSRLLDIPPWLLANFADRRFPYRCAPSVPGKGHGSRSFYTLTDIYKIALAHRMYGAGMRSKAIGEAMKVLSRSRSVFQKRAAGKAARCLVWREGRERPVLLKGNQLARALRGEMAIVLPLDETIARVDNRIRIFGKHR